MLETRNIEMKETFERESQAKAFMVMLSVRVEAYFCTILDAIYLNEGNSYTFYITVKGNNSHIESLLKSLSYDYQTIIL